MKVFFKRVTLITIITTYLLILAGSIVRSTGSGMGCPDWPKCFGMWIPPTEVSQLPTNYKEIFKVQGKKIANFDAFKTWTEYINRLLGVVVGLLMFLMLITSVSYWKIDKSLFFLSFFTFILTGFQGWVGSVVVAKNLAEGIITLHMMIAVAIIFLLIYIGLKVYKTEIRLPENVVFNQTIFIGIFCISLFQIILGTQVREAIDIISKQYNELYREKWIGELSIGFYIHRSFSWLILLAHVYLLYWVRNIAFHIKNINFLFVILLCFVLAEIITGASITYFSIPAFLQPLHLLLAILIVSWQFLIFLLVNPKLLFYSSKN